ncbi:MAG: metal-dependent transcriptional regulator, partial [Melioribacteraceae bacterium]|nr:metal-dependent transcriptional regulator [Melioribacteraceae bacterium]
VGEIDWHDEAEKIEHILTQKDADELSARMGNPKFDPHGDPIPDTDGNILENKGKLLNSLVVGDIVKVIHIEDEPKAIYLKLLERGLYPGKQILIVDKSDKNITVAADGDEFVLGSLVASKVSVEVLDEKEFKNEKTRTLIDLKPGEIGEVLNVSPNCRGQQRRRLLDFGIVPGSSISLHMSSPLNDPTAYLVKETIVALRKNQANKVLIK